MTLFFLTAAPEKPTADGQKAADTNWTVGFALDSGFKYFRYFVS